jgi:hypothetical protein
MSDTTGIQTAGDGIDWSYLNEQRVENAVITKLNDEAIDRFIKQTDINDEKTKYTEHIIEILPYYIKAFNQYLKDNKYKFVFTEVEELKKDNKDNKDKKDKKDKKQDKNKKDLIRMSIKQDSIKKDIKNFIDALIINNHYPYTNKDQLQSFFNIIYWSLYLISNKKKDLDLSIYLNCALSLFKCINDSQYFLTSIIIDESNNILNQIEEIINKKFKTSDDKIAFLMKYQGLLLESFWDKTKPKAISLYSEQADIISLITENLNNKLLIFFEMPPANGKTQLAVIIAKIIAHRNIENLKNIPNYKRKTLLYICYNTIVRNEVAKLCLTQSIDVKFWLAVTMMDKLDSKMKTFLRPYKNCYPDWRRKNLRSKKEEEAYFENRKYKYSENIKDQWKFFIEETKPVSEQYFKKEGQVDLYPNRDYTNPSNIPEMIISDLESALSLLKAYPDNFITYFDEAFALANSPITAEVMNVMGFTVLVSATLSKPEEIPTVIDNFKNTYGYSNNSDFLHVIKSSRQHISCTFIDENGYIYAPHHSIDKIDDMHSLISKLDIPLIKRSYSPEVVLDMVLKTNIYLPEELKFESRFPKYGMITHEHLRNYGCDIIHYIGHTCNEELFTILKTNNVKKMSNMDLNTIFTVSSVDYQYGNTLHISTLSDFNQHVSNISKPLLEGSPKISTIVSDYQKINNQIKNQITSHEKSSSDESKDFVSELQGNLENIKLSYPGEFIINTRRHSMRFGSSRKLVMENLPPHISVEDTDILDEDRTKLLFSNVGIYQPESFSNQKMDLFLRNKDSYRFILSTPSIVYGTNIGLTTIDIDQSFKDECSKNTLYQLVGRAGRRGKSDSATIIFRNNDMLKIIFSNEQINNESLMIEENFQKIQDEKIDTYK